jgi:hypothetical protein
MLNKKVVLLAVLICSSVSELFSGTLSSYSIGDVLLCFRKAVGANDMVVDLGPVSTFTNLAPNQRITITQYTGSQLALVGTNSLIWSVFSWYDSSVTPGSIQWTLFSSNPRGSLNTQTDPIVAYKQSAQHLAANQMAAAPLGAYDNFVTTNYNAASTSTAVIEPDNNSNPFYKTGQSYSACIGANFNFNDQFQGYPENTTPANFTLAGTVQRSDFYWLPPGNGLTTPGVFLGYFELNTNGVMSYVAYPTAVPTTPFIQLIGRTNNISYVTFTTGSSGTYTLRGSSTLTGPVSGWPAITSAAGNGSVITLQDNSSSSFKFYVITAQ